MFNQALFAAAASADPISDPVLLTSGTNSSGSTTYDQSVNLGGGMVGGGLLVFLLMGSKSAGPEVSSAKWDGVSLIPAATPVDSDRHISMWYLDSGTYASSATLQCIFDSSSNNFDWAVYEIMNASSRTPEVASNSGVLPAYSDVPMAVIGGAYSRSTISMEGIVKDGSTQVGSGGDHYSDFGSALVESLGGSYSISGNRTEVIAGWI